MASSPRSSVRMRTASSTGTTKIFPSPILLVFAEVLCNLGYRVSGSDISTSRVIEHLRSIGIDVTREHDAASISGVNVVVYSSAVAADNVELMAARAMRIPTVPRAEMLGELMRYRPAGFVVRPKRERSKNRANEEAIAAIADKREGQAFRGEQPRANADVDEHLHPEEQAHAVTQETREVAAVIEVLLQGVKKSRNFFRGLGPQ